MSQPGRHGWWALAVVVAVVLVALGVAGGLSLAPVTAPAGLQTAGDPTSAPVSVQQFADSRPVTVTYAAAPDVPLVLHVAGVVTTMPSGLVAKSGTAVVGVDGSPVIGLATAAPLYRSLTSGDSGADAGALNKELARLGYAAPSGATYTWATAQAWQALQKACGVTDPASDFDLGSAVWLPAAQVSVRAWPFALGAPTPSDSVLGVVPGAVQSATVALADGSPLPGDSRTLTVAGTSIPLPADGRVTDSAFLTATVGTAQQVSANGTDYQLQAQGAIALTQPLTVLAVPPVAVFGLSGTAGCVQVGGQAVAVTVVGSSLGVSLVQTSDGSTPDQVAIGAGITQTGCS